MPKRRGSTDRAKMSKRVRDLTGQRIGRWKVIDFAGLDERYQATWNCQCDCGTTRIVSIKSLGGGSQSCGCLAVDRTKEVNCLQPGESARRVVYGDYQRSAQRRGLVFDLTPEQFYLVTQQPCYYCGSATMRTRKTNESDDGFAFNGIDRADNSRGYTVDNVVPCCTDCNYGKGTMSAKEFLDWIQQVYCHVIGGQ